MSRNPTRPVRNRLEFWSALAMEPWRANAPFLTALWLIPTVAAAYTAATIGPGGVASAAEMLLWGHLALLVSALSGIFSAEYRGGTLELFVQSARPASLLYLRRAVARWCIVTVALLLSWFAVSAALVATRSPVSEIPAAILPILLFGVCLAPLQLAVSATGTRSEIVLLLLYLAVTWTVAGVASQGGGVWPIVAEAAGWAALPVEAIEAVGRGVRGDWNAERLRALARIVLFSGGALLVASVMIDRKCRRVPPPESAR